MLSAAQYVFIVMCDGTSSGLRSAFIGILEGDGWWRATVYLECVRDI